MWVILRLEGKNDKQEYKGYKCNNKPVITIKSTLKEENIEKLNELAKNLLK